MPKLVSLYIRHCVIGFGLSAVFVGLLFGFNIGNLWHLVSSSPVGWIAAGMLFVANGIVFAGAQFAFVILRMGANDETPKGPKWPAAAKLQPVPVRAAPRSEHPSGL